MKKVKKILLCILVLFYILIFSGHNVKAESSLYLDSLEFYVQVNSDSSIDVTEYWDIDIEETNTLYKTFKTDNTKYTEITDVKVTDITNGKNEEYIHQDEWQYHVYKGNYYGTENSNGDFEIGWGVGLDNSYGRREYKIEYKVHDAVTKYNDYAELYWQLLGKDFEIPARKITGTIILPSNAESKEDIKVWGHIETLNGTIYATDLNKIEFEVDTYSGNRMLEIRTLFPTEMIISAGRIEDSDILERAIEEETRWADEANARREAARNIGILMIVVPAIILDIIFGITIARANKNPILKQKKYVPEQKIEYYRDVPRKDATPGEAIQLWQKNSTNTLNYNDLGKAFSAALLNLKLKGYIDFKVDEIKKDKDKDKISIKITENSNIEQLESEEKAAYAFLDKVTSKKSDKTLTVKELQKEIKSNPTRVQKMFTDMGKNIEDSLNTKGLLDRKQAEEYSTTIGIMILQIIFLILFLGFAFAMSEMTEDALTKIVMWITGILGIVSIAKKISILKRINVFTQKGINEIEEWKGLKKYMEDFSLLKEREVPDIVIWEKFLVYATAFGIAEKVIKQLKMVYPNIEESMLTDHTMIYLMMNTDFSSSFSSAVNSSMSSVYSSGSGSGGGFSGGGGGGGGRRWRRRTLNIN